MILRHIPNALTVFRLLLIVPFLMFIYHQAYAYAFYTYLFAGFTDGLDGWLARTFHWQTRWGSFMDPIADKLLITCSFISLALLHLLPWWLVLLVILRDATISLGVIAWYGFIQCKIDFSPTRLSKLNTALQLMLVTICLIKLAFFNVYPGLLYGLMQCTALTTSVSFIDYVWTWGKKACASAQPQ